MGRIFSRKGKKEDEQNKFIGITNSVKPRLLFFEQDFGFDILTYLEGDNFNSFSSERFYESIDKQAMVVVLSSYVEKPDELIKACSEINNYCKLNGTSWTCVHFGETDPENLEFLQHIKRFSECKNCCVDNNGDCVRNMGVCVIPSCISASVESPIKKGFNKNQEFFSAGVFSGSSVSNALLNYKIATKTHN
jgi:hypothetical protein